MGGHGYGREWPSSAAVRPSVHGRDRSARLGLDGGRCMGWCAAHRACAYSAIASATSMTLSEILRRRELIVSLCGSATAVARGAMLRRIACEGWASTAFVKSRLRAMASFPISVQLAPNPYGVFIPTGRAHHSLGVSATRRGCFVFGGMAPHRDTRARPESGRGG